MSLYGEGGAHLHCQAVHGLRRAHGQLGGVRAVILPHKALRSKRSEGDPARVGIEDQATPPEVLATSVLGLPRYRKRFTYVLKAVSSDRMTCRSLSCVLRCSRASLESPSAEGDAFDGSSLGSSVTLGLVSFPVVGSSPASDAVVVSLF